MPDALLRRFLLDFVLLDFFLDWLPDFFLLGLSLQRLLVECLPPKLLPLGRLLLGPANP